MTQLVGCMQQKEAPENLSYAAEQIPVTYKAETELLKKYPDMLNGEAVEIEYDFECKEYRELLCTYKIEEIAGDGTEFERVMRLVDEFAGRLVHESYYDNSIEENALALLEYSLDNPKHGINCRAKAEILNEMCLALGIYARSVSIMPYSSVDPDSHVVNEIYDTNLEKWIMVDLTTGGYVVDENDVPMSVLEIRQRGAAGADCAFVYNGEKIGPEEYTTGWGDNLTYYMKNVFYFAVSKYQGFGARNNFSDKVFFIPENFELRNQMLSSYNADMEFAKENPEYSDWIEDIEANMSALRDVTLVVGDAETIYN